MCVCVCHSALKKWENTFFGILQSSTYFGNLLCSTLITQQKYEVAANMSEDLRHQMGYFSLGYFSHAIKIPNEVSETRLVVYHGTFFCYMYSNFRENSRKNVTNEIKGPT